MYILNASDNRVTKLEQKSFNELGFKERSDLQEWIANDPGVLGEELLIIQKEFSGFNDTNERLDLLALDKHGDLVVIENKLDDSGRDVTWQALKYASYCSSLSKDNIRKIYQDYLDKKSPGANAEDKLSEYFDNSDYEEITINKGVTQRIILIAANFRKEVTSTVLWLLNYKVRLQCIRVAPYQHNEQLLLNFDQIIPLKDTEEFIIKMAEKAQDDLDSQKELKQRHILRLEFWSKLLNVINAKCSLFQNISPSKYNWIAAGSGLGGASLNFVVSKTYCRVEVYIDRKVQEENKYIFDELYKYKNEIEISFENQIIWERLDEKRASRIKVETDGNLFDEEQWDKMIEFMTDNMVIAEKTFKPYLQKISRKLKQQA
jgi:hypothetical protein